jgi:uncharacterized protein (DUF2267 family)
MNTSGLAALDHTVQETNVWLKAVAEQLHFEDRHHAYNALRAVLHTLRDRLPPEVAVHLGAQLPTLMRGIYYEGWHMVGKPMKDRSAQEFADHVLKELPPRFPMDAADRCPRRVRGPLGEARSGRVCKTRGPPAGFRQNLADLGCHEPASAVFWAAHRDQH